LAAVVGRAARPGVTRHPAGPLTRADRQRPKLTGGEARSG
jgi:hypothetical protein